MRFEFFEKEDKLEVKYYEDGCDSCLSWRIPLRVVNEFVLWRPTVDVTQVKLPIKVEKKNCTFEIVHPKWVYLKEIYDNGYREVVGWDLPENVQEAIIQYYLKKRSKFKMSKVYIIMGSKSDIRVAQKAVDVLDDFGIDYKIHIASAHRTPLKVEDIIVEAEKEGCQVIIAIAGMAAHLPGVIASKTLIPVIGVPVAGSIGSGSDALFSIVQMPTGIPVACMAISGSANAALYAIQILALKDEEVKQHLALFRVELEKDVEKFDSQLQEEGIEQFRYSNTL